MPTNDGAFVLLYASNDPGQTSNWLVKLDVYGNQLFAYHLYQPNDESNNGNGFVAQNAIVDNSDNIWIIGYSDVDTDPGYCYLAMTLLIYLDMPTLLL
jgi:hypothetical protein